MIEWKPNGKVFDYASNLLSDKIRTRCSDFFRLAFSSTTFFGSAVAVVVSFWLWKMWTFFGSGVFSGILNRTHMKKEVNSQAICVKFVPKLSNLLRVITFTHTRRVYIYTYRLYHLCPSEPSTKNCSD